MTHLPHYMLFLNILSLLKWNSYISLQHRSMASVGALLMFLPVAWTCSPQKAGNVAMVQRLDGTCVMLPSQNTGRPIDHTYHSIQPSICQVHWEFD